MAPAPGNPPSGCASPVFATTLWSMVQMAGLGQDGAGAQALEKLCRIYWYPLYAFARRSGLDHEQARDRTQGFFAYILGNQFLARADRARGRFRSYLLKSFSNFMEGERLRDQAIKRGANVEHVPLDIGDAEARYQMEPADPSSPEKLFERRWAVLVIGQALARLEAEFRGAGKEDQFKAMHPYLLGENKDANLTLADLGRALQISEEAARVAMHRLRARYRQALREEVAQTVETEEELQDELKHLLRVFST